MLLHIAVTGAFLADGLHEIDGVLYAFSEKCVLLKNTELVVDGVTYTIDENGVATLSIESSIPLPPPPPPLAFEN